MSTKDLDREYSEIEIDMDTKLLIMLIEKADEFLYKSVQSHSYSIWEDNFLGIETVYDLHTLVGECLINDILIDAICTGLDLDIENNKEEEKS